MVDASVIDDVVSYLLVDQDEDIPLDVGSDAMVSLWGRSLRVVLPALHILYFPIVLPPLSSIIPN